MIFKKHKTTHLPGSLLESLDIDLRIGDFGAVSTEIGAEPLPIPIPIDELVLGNPFVGDRRESARPVDRSLTEGTAVGEAGFSATISS